MTTNVVFQEALSRATSGGFIITVLVHTDMASPHLAHGGSAEQKTRWLPRIITGELITAVAVTEPDAGSDVAAIRTRAVRDGDDWVLNGSKMFITNGVLADLVFVAARTDPDAKGSRGISIFAVERGTPGFRVGRALSKQGWLASDTAELVFDDCRVPASHLIGAENGGFHADHAQLPDRTHRTGRDGGRTLPDDARPDASVRERPQGLRRVAVGQADDPPATRHAGGEDRGRAAAALPLRVARRPAARRRARNLDAEGADRRAGQRGRLQPASSSTAAWATCAKARSSGWCATRACWRSAAAPPR